MNIRDVEKIRKEEGNKGIGITRIANKILKKLL